MYSIVTAKKEFTDRWIGSDRLNRWKLHVLRMRTAEAATRLRSRRVRDSRDERQRLLREQGVVVISDFLPRDRFDQIRRETRQISRQIERSEPLVAGSDAGYGDKISYSWGFDRYDGGTLNRFIDIERESLPYTAALAHEELLLSLSRVITGMPFRQNQLWVYQTRNGDESAAPDLQKVLHRDTFFSSMKFWYFVEPVTEEDGPFVYVPGSHELTKARLEWEHQRALVACEALKISREKWTAKQSLAVGGSFRIDEGELEELQLPAPESFPVAENTLIVANTLGFHRRGDALPDTTRLAVYGNRRPMFPFGILGH